MYNIFFVLSSIFSLFFNIYIEKNVMIKELLKKYLLEYVNEADPMGHFNDRVGEVVEDIIAVTMPPNVYVAGATKEKQDAWVISQIQDKLKEKINTLIATDYPIGKGKNEGICVLVPLGMLKVQPLKGNPATISVTAKRKEDVKTGISYYVGIYDNRMPSLVLADPTIAANRSPHLQLQAHMNNNLRSGWPVNKERSYVDKSFMDNIVVNMADFPMPKKEPAAEVPSSTPGLS